MTTARAATLSAPILTRRVKPRAKVHAVVARGGDRWIILTVAMLKENARPRPKEL